MLSFGVLPLGSRAPNSSCWMEARHSRVVRLALTLPQNNTVENTLISSERRISWSVCAAEIMSDECFRRLFF